MMKKFQIQLINNKTSDIFMGNGLVKQLNPIFDSFSKDTHFIIITDKNIFKYYGEVISKQFFNYQYNIIFCPDGEKAKELSNIENIYSDLIKHGCNKKTCLVAFGGGVIGDTTGFIAATFMRGIKYINIPTSLLAMVDSSIGGKTGFNLPAGKNLVGAIYHPDKIIIDSELLNTLPVREYHSGVAEIIKYSLILDEKLFLKLENCLEKLISGNCNPKLLNEIIMKCIQLKIEIVEQDENDDNIRNILNFGHTIGHAIESYYGYEFINHGEAVAYGMLYAAKLSNLHGNLSDQELANINSLINQLKLPIIKNIEIEKILDLIKNDKKNTSSGLTFILLDKIGQSKISKNISYNNIKTVLMDHEYISY